MTKKQLQKKGVEFSLFYEVQWLEYNQNTGLNKKKRGIARQATIPLRGIKHVVRVRGTEEDDINKRLIQRCSQLLEESKARKAKA